MASEMNCSSRKAVLPVVERIDHLLIYPVQYEGVEQSPNVVYLGPAPNQQILPALRWLVGFEGKKRWFLVGSDYVFPVTASAVIRAIGVCARRSKRSSTASGWRTTSGSS